jgi:hypothetical protein
VTCVNFTVYFSRNVSLPGSLVYPVALLVSYSSPNPVNFTVYFSRNVSLV